MDLDLVQASTSVHPSSLAYESEDEEAPSGFPASAEYAHLVCDEGVDEKRESLQFQSEGSDVEVSKDFTLNQSLQCMTCSNFATSFYCYGCIKHGEFYSKKSSEGIKEKFAEKKFKLISSAQEKTSISAAIDVLLQKKVEMVTLETEINKKIERISRLKTLLENKKDKLQVTQNKCSEMAAKIKNGDRLTKDHKEKKINFSKEYISKLKARADVKSASRQTNLDGIKELTWELSYKLTSNIFTLEVYNTDESETVLTNSEESRPLLGYQTSSTFDHFHSNNETKYTIVEPWISASADISSYLSWLNRHRLEVASSTASSVETLEMRNDVYRTTAALSYLSQMTDVLAGLFDVWLPKRLDFREFYSKPNRDVEFLGEEEMKHKIAKLNTNVAFICLSQKADPGLINPKQAVRNIKDLLNPALSSDLGRRGAISFEPEFLETLEKQLLSDLMSIDESSHTCYWHLQERDQDFEMDFDMIPVWSVGNDMLPSPTDSNSLMGSYFPGPTFLSSVIRIFK